MQPGIDYLHTGIAEGRGDDLGAAIMAVEPGLTHQHTDLAFHRHSYRARGPVLWRLTPPPQPSPHRAARPARAPSVGSLRVPRRTPHRPAETAPRLHRAVGARCG